MEVSQYKVSSGVGGTLPLNHEMHFSLCVPFTIPCEKLGLRFPFYFYLSSLTQISTVASKPNPTDIP